MSSDEPVRKHVQPESAPQESPAALVSLPSAATLASLSVSGLLFGGLLCMVVGATWAALAVSVPVAVVVGGFGMALYGVVLAQILARLGVF